MESIFFVISYTTGFFNETWKKISVIFSKPYHFLLNIFRGRTKSKNVEDVQELTDDEYNRRFGKFFPKIVEEVEVDEFVYRTRKRGAGFYSSLGQAMANGAHCGSSDGGPGFYS